MAKKEWITKGADGLSFRERLGDLIAERGITQVELSKATGIGQPRLSDYIAGKLTDPESDTRVYAAPDCATVITLAKYFSVSTDYLLGLTAIKTPSIDMQAIVSATGISEDNVRYLNLLHVTNGPHTAFANDLLSFLLHDDEMAIRYMQMRKAHDLPRPISWFDLYCEGKISYEEYEQATEENIEDGYIQLSGRAAFEYYCSKIADSIEKHLIAKYSETARWNKSEDNE